jgi:aryl carrier-like protein
MVYKRIQRSEALQKLMAELLEEELDLHEGKLRELGFDSNNVTALLAFLNARGKHRGYGQQRFEVKGEFGHKHDHVHRRADELDDAEAVEEWRRLISSGETRKIN